MPNLPWFKVYTEILDSYKLRSLSDAQKWRFLQLLALAGECGSEGYLVEAGKPLQVVDIAWRLRMDTAEMLKDLQALANHDLILLDKATGAWLVPSFARRQAQPDEGARAYWREKKRRERSAPRPSSADEEQEARAELYQTSDQDTKPEGFYPQPEYPEAIPQAGTIEDENPFLEFVSEEFLDTVREDGTNTFQENVPLKRRIEKIRGEKREKERRRGESQRPPPAGRGKSNSPPNYSVFDEVERELAAKDHGPPAHQGH